MLVSQGTGTLVVGRVVHIGLASNLRALFSSHYFRNIVPDMSTKEDAARQILRLHDGRAEDALFRAVGLVIVEYRLGKPGHI